MMNRIDPNRQGLASLGRDEDRYMAHVAPGEMVVPPVITPETRQRLQQEMTAAGLSPENYTVGEGMSINPITGLPEFGWLKKTFKSVVKVAKVVAPLAAFVPGIGTAFGAVLGGIGGGITSALGTIAPGLASSLGGLASSAMTGIAGLGIPGFSSMAGGAAQGFSGLKGLGSLSGMLKGGPLAGLMGGGPQLTPVSDTMDGPIMAYEDENGKRYTLAQAAALQNQGSFFGGSQPMLDVNGQPILNAQGQPVTQQSNNPFGNLLSGGQSGGMGGLGSLGIAGFLGKMAYDSAKKKEGGISETPKVTMDQLGRYQLASDLGTGGTRGEFGLAPKPAVLSVAEGGPIDSRMYYAKGGVAEIDMRDGGESEGPGTGTSDDIPAMLSDGEFVMTAAATKGAGAFNLNKTKSGIELISGGKASRKRGVKNMRELMNIFEAI